MTVIPFSPWPRSYAVLNRWAATAPGVANWWVQPDPETGRLTTVTEDGDEYAALTVGGPDEDAVYHVVPTGGDRWGLRDTRTDALRGTFSTLSEALESVCRTLPEVA